MFAAKFMLISFRPNAVLLGCRSRRMRSAISTVLTLVGVIPIISRSTAPQAARFACILTHRGFSMKGWRTIALNAAIAAAVGVLGWASSFDWTGIVSPTVAIIIVTGANIALRFITTTPVGQSE